MPKVVGFKVWYVDGSHQGVRLGGRTPAEGKAAINLLPAADVLLMMIYFDQFSQDGRTRYRRIAQGRDFYYVGWDDAAPADRQDWLFGQTDRLEDLASYPTAKVFTGRTVNDDFFSQVVAAAMADRNMTELGITPVANTDDR